MNRWLLAVAAALCTTGTFRLYSHFLLPLTELRSKPIPPPMAGETDFQPLIFAQTAEEYFPDAPWTRTALVKWQRSDKAFLFAESLSLERDRAGKGGAARGNAVRMSRVAMLWKDPQRPEARPFRLIADSARIQFENPFLDSAVDLSNADPGRIVYASLDGSVLLDGPDGIRLAGENFVFSEQAAQLYSDHPVRFAYGPTPDDDLTVRGSAGRIVLGLTPTEKSILGDDMPLIAGVSTLQLRSDVRLEMSFQAEGRPSSARLTCRGAFDYDFKAKTALFTEAVLVRRFPHPRPSGAASEELSCERLQLQFEERRLPDEPPRTPGDQPPLLDSAPLLNGLQLRTVHAWGRPAYGGQPAEPVVARSDPAKLTARCTELMYDRQRLTATLVDQKAVHVVQGNAVFESPWIHVRHTESGQLVELDCRGKGNLKHHDPRWGADPVEASWNGGVLVKPDAASGLQTIDLTERVKLLLPGPVGVAANRLRLWVDPDVLAGIQQREQLLSGQLPIHRIDAIEKVRLISDQLYVKEAAAITAFIRPGDVAPAPGRQPVLQAGTAASDTGAAPAEPWVVDTDQLQIELVHDPKTALLDLRQIRGRGRTQVSGSPQSADVAGYQTQGSVVLSGFDLQLKSDGQRRQTLTVDARLNEHGDVEQWAQLSQGDVKIEGARLQFDRDRNLAGVVGQGRLQLPLTRDLNGRELDSPAMLTVTWTERMEFDGRQARFFGRVRTSMQNQRENISVSCEMLRVMLDRRLSFTDEHQDTKGLKLVELQCQHRVKLDAYEWTGTTITAKRSAELAEVLVNQSTGKLFGRGPGTIEFWTLGGAVKLSPNAPKANRPADPARPQWRYTKIQFAGQIEGNLHQHFAELQERVELLSAPVPEPSQRFRVEQLTESTPQAENAALLKCDRLRVTQRSRTTGESDYNELLAYDSVELEGHSFRATANELAYDERSGKFVFRGHGQNARLHFMDPGGTWQAPSEGLFITFDPVKRIVIVDGLSGASGSF